MLALEMPLARGYAVLMPELAEICPDLRTDAAPVEPTSRSRLQQRFWNQLVGDYQSDEQLWRWSGNWDL